MARLSSFPVTNALAYFVSASLPTKESVSYRRLEHVGRQPGAVLRRLPTALDPDPSLPSGHLHRHRLGATTIQPFSASPTLLWLEQ
jgi:hypothetical protein